MSYIPHPDSEFRSLNCAVITISDTRTTDNDRSGKLITELLENAGHQIITYEILKDNPSQIQELLTKLGINNSLEVIIFNGGTGIAPRDTTYDVISVMLDKVLTGFGELFRFLSYEEIGSRAIATRAIGGVYHNKLVFSLPGSTNAVKLALEKLILPEINHLTKEINSSLLSRINSIS
jgi:molybdenum cofactor biosynthesis protein B